MLFQFDQLSANQRYHLITQTITPRPIAWIMTKNTNDTYNLAPFSYFAALSSDPALLVVSIVSKPEQVIKDTKKNLLSEKECVLHIPSGDLINAVNDSAANLPYGESELEKSDLSLVSFVDRLPRIAEAKVALHCRLYDIHQLGNSSTDACYLEIVNVYIDDDIVSQENNRTTIDSQRLNPLSRLGGNDYSLLGKIVTLKRPN
ncbi:flavin reductase family protein [Marinomonas transparens]|uniref:Flavin reductase family protein n=1 Tax=Marinomonas transparens TaxID=2795388 RepID=A0A934JZV7_9GAMM|nr:flavin reductase family protein [Marinomonas transparens]MBJ7539937.1 flavin reductase family protein [Marinomonas transparens]